MRAAPSRTAGCYASASIASAVTWATRLAMKRKTRVGTSPPSPMSNYAVEFSKIAILSCERLHKLDCDGVGV
jgi:hypothetical protein